MSEQEKYVAFGGRMVMVGCGSIGRGVLPLILRHLAICPGQITIVTADDRARAEADEFGIEYRRVAPTRRTFAPNSRAASAPATSW